MADKKTWNEYLDEPFKRLAKDVAPNEKAVSGELGDEIFDEVFGKPHQKKLPGPKSNKPKGLLDL